MVTSNLIYIFINYFNYTPLSVPIAFDDVINIHKIKSDLHL